MITYNLFLDGVEMFDRPKGLDEIILTIEREDGFKNTEQILRDSMQANLSFRGDGYRYICSKRKENYCEEILISVDGNCNGYTYTLFEGLIKQADVEIIFHEVVAKVDSIKDNSFSGLIRDWINVEIPLYNTRTKNCEAISLPFTIINTPTLSISGVDYSLTDVKMFDVLDVMKYIVGFFTDNRIDVKSDYFTNSKWAITPGFNLHNNTGTLDQVYPKESLEGIFTELRKVLVIYQGIQYEDDGTPYLRIEAESDFYTNVELLVIDKLPNDASEKMNEEALFNKITVGSKTVKLQAGSEVIQPQNRLEGWNEEVYIGCGGCSGQKDSNLDAVTKYVVDANVIHEAMQWPIPADPADSDYANDDAVFLINYYDAGIGTHAYRFHFPAGYNSTAFDEQGYNYLIKNRQVLERWAGVSNSCISVGRYTRYGFQAVNGPDINVDEVVSGLIDYISFIDGISGCTLSTPYTYHLGCKTEIFDNMNAHSISTDFGDACSSGGYVKSMFTAQEDGAYKFHAKSDIKPRVHTGVTDDLVDADFEVRFVVYADNTLTTIIASSPTTAIHLPDNASTINFDIDSPTFSLAVGNVVMIEVSIVNVTIGAGGRAYIFHLFNSVFELLEDNTSCENIEDETDSFMPFLTTLSYPLSLAQYMLCKSEKGGYITVQGQTTRIKKLDYRPDKVSTLVLKHKRSLCGCTT